jgi:hypothetical protein
MFIGKPLRAWGQLVSLPDPEPDQPVQKNTTKGKGKTTLAGRKSKRIQLFVGSLEPLLVARRRRRLQGVSESLPPLMSDVRDANAGDGNPDDVDSDVDADGDTDDGIWPGEFVVPTIVVTEPEMERETEVGARITPEEVVRAIGAAFAFA